jgi:ribosomal protein S18 acetylase RimI-like enzyme
LSKSTKLNLRFLFLYSRLECLEYNLFVSIRPFQLPQDIDLMSSLVVEGFQYPENPAWSVQEDEIQGMVDRINSAKRLWPVIGILRIFVPLFRDILCGFIDEEEGRPAGLINYMRQRNTPEWYIGNVTVLPAYRRRGIACRLVQATLDELYHRGAKAAFLDVVVGNDPAFHLYKEMGFEEFTQSYEYQLHRESLISPEPLPTGYQLKPLSRFDWKTGFRFAQRVTPDYITRYEPVTEARFRVPWLLPLIGGLLNSMGSSQNERFAIFESGRKIVAIGQYSYRTHEGGTNSADVSIDPDHPELAGFILHHVFSEIQNTSPGHRIEVSFEDWESRLIQCAEAMGCEKRYGMHRMGLRFSRPSQ